MKTDTNAFDYEITAERWTLGWSHTGHFYDAAIRDGKCDVASVDVELRPVWRLEIRDKSGKYIYKERFIDLDKEVYYPAGNYFTDARGTLMRTWYDSWDWVPESGLHQWRQVPIWNTITNRMTFLTMDARWDDLENNPTVATFDVDQLRDYSQ